MTIGGFFVLTCFLLFAGLALYALLSGPSRAGLISAWIAMTGFGSLALFSFWRIQELRNSWGPVLYEIPVDPSGLHQIALQKIGISTGLRGRLVLKGDPKTAAPLTPEQDRLCRWNVVWTPWHLHDSDCTCSEREVWFNLEDLERFPHLLDYHVTDQTKPLLSKVALEVRCSLHFRENINIGSTILRTFMVGFLVGLILAAFGASSQRRRGRQLRAASSPSAPPPPDVS